MGLVERIGGLSRTVQSTFSCIVYFSRRQNISEQPQGIKGDAVSNMTIVTLFSLSTEPNLAFYLSTFTRIKHASNAENYTLFSGIGAR